MTLAQRYKDWRGPSKRELMAQIVHLQETRKKFPGLGGQIASGAKLGYGEFQYDPNRVLHGADKYKIFDKMESDPHVKGVLIDKALPLLTAEWEVTPASDKPKDIEVAEFVAANLLRQPSDKFGRDYWLQTSWKAQRLPEILSMLLDGFALFVSSWKRVGTQVVYDRLQWIEPTTIDGTTPWEIDDQDNILAVNRKLTTPQENFIYDERIEAERLKLYVWDIKGARFEGRSFVRAMYGACLRKEMLLRQSAVWAQKVGAPMPIVHYPDSMSAADIAKVKQIAMASRGESPAEGFAMFPKGSDDSKVEVEYAGAEHSEVDRMRPLIDGENKEIHQGGRDSSAMLGETGGGGSRALGESKGKGEIKLTQAIGEIVGEWENHGVANLTGVVEELVNRNFTVNAYPQLACSKIDPYEDFKETLEAWKAGIIPKHEDARRQICEGTLGLNLSDDAYEIEPLPPGLPNANPLGDGNADEPGDSPPPGTEPDKDQAAAALAAKDELRERIKALLQPAQEGSPRKGGRFPDCVGVSSLQPRRHLGQLQGGGAGHPAGAAGNESSHGG